MRRKSWLLLSQSLVGLALLTAWLIVVDIEELTATLGLIRWSFLGLAATLGLLSLLVRSMRWRLVLLPVANLPLKELIPIGLASSLINFVVPIRSGELARGVLLKQRHSVSLSVSLPTVALDRSLDLLAVLLIGLVGAIGGYARGSSTATIILLGGILFLAFAGLVTFALLARQRLLAVITQLIPKCLGPRFKDELTGIAEGFLAGLASVGQQPIRLVPLIGLSLIAALIDALVFVVLFANLQAGVGPLAILVGYGLFAMTFIIPGAPGYVGSMEALGSLVFSALGIATATAASGIVAFHAINALVLAIGGTGAFWMLGVRPGQVLRSALDRKPEVSPEAGEAL